MAEEGEGEAGWHARGRVLPTTFPLNSRRLTARVIKGIARELGLDVSAGAREDILLAVEGKIGHMGREPQNVRVEITEYDGKTIAVMRDEQGTVVESTLEEAQSEQDRNLGEESSGDVDRESDGVTIREGLGNKTAALEDEISRLASENVELREKTSRLSEDITSLNVEVSRLRGGMEEEREKYRRLWRDSCQQLAEYDGAISEKEVEVATLKVRVAELESVSSVAAPPRLLPPLTLPPPPASHPSVFPHSPSFPPSLSITSTRELSHPQRRGRAPPIDPFDGESVDVRFDDWFPMLERAATWNGWSEEGSPPAGGSSAEAGSTRMEPPGQSI